MGTKEDLLLWFIIFFDKKSASLPDKSTSGNGVNIEVKHNEKLGGELHKPIIRNYRNGLFWI